MALRGVLRGLYLRGPIWGGLPQPDVCAQLTAVASQVWQAMPEACSDHIDRKVDSILIGTTLFLITITLYRAASGFWYRRFVVQPLIEAMRGAPRLPPA